MLIRQLLTGRIALGIALLFITIFVCRYVLKENARREQARFRTSAAATPRSAYITP